MRLMLKDDLDIVADKLGIRRGHCIKRKDLIGRINQITGLTQ